MHNKNVRVAICYDFDGTLSPGNMQEYNFFPALDLSSESFWERSNRLAEHQQADQILAYMYTMLDRARAGNVSIRREQFTEFGKGVRLFKGVESWFKRVNEYGKTLGLDIEHYVISSGLKEMIEGTPIAREFKHIYASSFMYDVNGIAIWPAQAINYTSKTQFIFRINKGALNIQDNRAINAYMKENERDIPFSRMIYMGDGETDIPAMRLVKDKGGYSIALYADTGDANAQNLSQKMVQDQRVNFTSVADYSKNKKLEHLISHILQKIATEKELLSFSPEL